MLNINPSETIGNIDLQHPYFDKMLDFCQGLLCEMPFHNTVNSAIQALLSQGKFSSNEYILMFPQQAKDIPNSLVDYINYRTYQQAIRDDFQEKGVKAILKSLIMFQIKLQPNMSDNFKKILGNCITSQSPFQHSKRLHSLVSFLWYCAGDTATDYNYYSKRFLLSQIYLKVMFYAYSDTSEEFQDTEKYLIQEFDKIGKIEKLKAKLPNITKIEGNITSFIGKLRYKLT